MGYDLFEKGWCAVTKMGERTTGQKKKAIMQSAPDQNIFIIHCLLVGCFLLLGGLLLWLEPSFNAASYIYSLAFLLLAGWCVWSSFQVSAKWLTVYNVLLLSMLLFNGGYYFAQLFHPFETIILEGNSALDGNFSNSILTQTTVFVFWGVASFHLGGLWALTRSGQSRDVQHLPQKPVADENIKKDLRVVGWGLLLVSVIPALLIQHKTVLLVLRGSYKATATVRADMGYGSVVRILSTLLIPGSIFLIVASEKRLWPLIAALCGLAIHVLPQFFIGDRSGAAMFLVMALVAWDRSVKSISKKTLVTSALILLFVVFPVIQVTRMVPGSERTNIGAYITAFTDIQTPFELTLNNMGRSIGIISHTLRLVPTYHGYMFGESYLRGASTIFPNLFWDVHPGSKFLGGSWFTEAVISDYRMLTGHGVGYNMLAEAYVNFYIAGILMVPCLFGFAVSWLSQRADSSGGAVATAMVITFGAFILQIPRGCIGSAIRPMVWYSLAPCLAVYLHNKWRMGSA